MNTAYSFMAFGLILTGAMVMSLGIWTRLGKNRAWYLVPNYYVLLPKGGHYAMPLGGLMIILVGISLLVPTPELSREIWLYGIFPIGFVSVLVIIFQPSWLKPKWVRWLEENHGDILEILIREGRETPNWGEKVSTQEGLEEWVEEVRRKRGLKRKRERR